MWGFCKMQELVLEGTHILCLDINIMTLPKWGFSVDGKMRNCRPWNSILCLLKANITPSLSCKEKKTKKHSEWKCTGDFDLNTLTQNARSFCDYAGFVVVYPRQVQWDWSWFTYRKEDESKALPCTSFAVPNNSNTLNFTKFTEGLPQWFLLSIYKWNLQNASKHTRL